MSKFKDIQGPLSCFFKDKFSTEVYSMHTGTAIFNAYFCETVQLLRNKTSANVVLGKVPGRLKVHVDKKLDDNNV